MKSNRNVDTNSTRGLSGGINNRPEIRDNLDSRKNEEQENKGNDVTHNKKDVQNERSKKHKNRE